MRDVGDGTPPAARLSPGDLSQFTEAMRRKLYDAIVAEHFSPTPEKIRRAEEADDYIELHTPEETGLSVFHLFYRWFAVWRMLEEPPDAPAKARWEVVTVHENPNEPHGFGFSEV